MARIWVAVLHISYKVEQKLIHEHQLDPNDVRQAVVGRRGVPFTWHNHPERGWRAIAETNVGSDRCLVVLYPTSVNDPDQWNLGSAYPLDR